MGFFTKGELEYNKGEKFFIYNGKIINFDEIQEIDSKVTKEMQNSVYIKRELVVKLYLQTGVVELRSDTKTLERYRLLRELAKEIQIYKGAASQEISLRTPLKKESKYLYYFWIPFILFGLNGLSEIWFGSSLLSNVQFFAVISAISGILLGVIIITTPMIFFANKLNMRKFQREEDFLAGRESSVKDIEYSNFLVVILVALLVYLVYGEIK